MEIIEIISITTAWIATAFLSAAMTFAISIFAGCKHPQYEELTHLIFWVILPFTLVCVVLSTVYILLCLDNKKLTIVKNFKGLFKRLAADWSDDDMS